MAAMQPLSPEEQELAMKRAGADLSFLLDREGIDRADQAMLYHVDVTTVSRLAAFASDAADLKATLKRAFDMDADAGLLDRVRVTKLVVAWQSAQTRSEKVAQLEGEQAAMQLPKPLAGNDYTVMRMAYQTKWWKLDEKQTPSRSFMERLLDSVEADEPRAFSLEEVTNKEEEDPDLLTEVRDATGALRLARGRTRVPMPVAPEMLRKRVILMGVAHMMAAYRHTNRAWLQDQTPQDWQQYLEYLLGEWVFGLVARDSSGHTLSTPAWSVVLDYELAIRKDMCRRIITTGCKLSVALVDSCRCPVLKERHFTTPVAFNAIPVGIDAARSKRPREDPPPTGGGRPVVRASGPPGPLGRNKRKSAQKGKGKGTKREGNASQSTGCARVTPDGGLICYGFNNKEENCKRKDCRFLHVCGLCYGNHPMFRCSPEIKDTAGRH